MKSNKMKIISWNVNMDHGSVDVPYKTEALVRYVRDLDPDVIFLQETCAYTNKKIGALGYACYGMTRTHMMFCSILARNGIAPADYKEYPQMGQSITLNGIEMVNCHLTPFKENSLRRRRQTAPFDRPKTFLMGDFNTDGDMNFEFLTESEVSKSDLQPTWHLSYFQRGSDVKKRFDRVFTDAKILGYRVHKILFSDHYPVEAEI